MAKETKDWEKIQEQANTEHKDLLTLFADPKSDEILISFAGHNCFVKFPFKDMASGVVFNALRQSKFKEAIDAFMTGVIESTGIDVSNKEGNELLNVVGGSMKSIGLSRSQLKTANKKSNGKK